MVFHEGIVAICVEELIKTITTRVDIITSSPVENIIKWSSNKTIVSGAPNQGNSQLIRCIDLNSC